MRILLFMILAIQIFVNPVLAIDRAQLVQAYNHSVFPHYQRILSSLRNSEEVPEKLQNSYDKALKNYHNLVDRALSEKNILLEEKQLFEKYYRKGLGRRGHYFECLKAINANKAYLARALLDTLPLDGAALYLSARFFWAEGDTEKAEASFSESFKLCLDLADINPEDRLLADIVDMWLEGPILKSKEKMQEMSHFAGEGDIFNIPKGQYGVVKAGSSIIHAFRLGSFSYLRPIVAGAFSQENGRALQPLRHFILPHAQALVNGTFFSGGSGNPLGQIVVDGRPIYSPAHSILALNRSIICVLDTGKTVFLESSLPAERLANMDAHLLGSRQPGKIVQAIGGAGWLLKDGRIIWERAKGIQKFDLSFFDSRRPRTIIAIGGESVWAMVMDGYPSSKPMTMVEMARWLYDNGFVDAVFLDGGGSSQLVVEGNTQNSSEGVPGRKGHSFEGRPISTALAIMGMDDEELGFVAYQSTAGY